MSSTWNTFLNFLTVWKKVAFCTFQLQSKTQFWDHVCEWTDQTMANTSFQAITCTEYYLHHVNFTLKNNFATRVPTPYPNNLKLFLLCKCDVKINYFYSYSAKMSQIWTDRWEKSSGIRVKCCKQHFTWEEQKQHFWFYTSHWWEKHLALE